MAKQTKQKSIEETLWDSANKLRGSVESSEFNQKEWRETNELVDDPRSPD